MSIYLLLRPVEHDDLTFLNWENLFFYITIYRDIFGSWKEVRANWTLFQKNRAFVEQLWLEPRDCAICFDSTFRGIETPCRHFFHLLAHQKLHLRLVRHQKLAQH